MTTTIADHDPILLFDRSPRFAEQLQAEQRAEVGATYQRMRRDLMPEETAKARARAEARLRATMAAELAADEAALREAARTDRDAALLRHLRLVCDLHGIQILGAPGKGAEHLARRTPRHIQLREQAAPFEVYYVGLHEAGHLLAGPCRGPEHWREHHRGCLRCELDAWTVAQRLALDWPRDAHAFMGTCLGTYRTTTAGPVDVQCEIDRLMGSWGFKREQQRRLRRTLAAEQENRR